jgi:hypothetical protein
MAAPRVRIYDHEAVIQGARGRVCMEQILTPLTDAPEASWRVLARWTGLLPPGAIITVAGRRLVVLRLLPIGGRRNAAHFLCRDAGESAWD